MMNEPLYFVHISDTHIGDTKEYARHGHVSWDCTADLIQRLNNLPIEPDFVVHTGDVTTDPTPQAYALATDLFKPLKWPIYYVAGNHDLGKSIRYSLPMPDDVEWLSKGDDCLVYRFERKGTRFLTLDARPPAELDPHGFLPKDQLRLLAEECHNDGPPLVVFIHFPLLPIDSTWLDAYMLVVNGRQIHRTLLQAKHRLRGVFFGHIHQPLQIVHDGILYVSAASAFSQFHSWPEHAQLHFDTEMPPGFNFVKLLPEQVIVRAHTFPRP